MKGLGRRAKHLVEQALVRSGVAFGVRTLRSSPGVILAYHNIVPRGERADGDGSLHLSADVFGQHLDALLESHDVVSLTEVTVAREGGGRPRAAITFDDAYAGAVKAGLAELRSRGLPATIFVAPGRLGRQTFWWDALADDGAVPPRVREYALEMLAGQQERVLAWAATAGIRRRVPSEVEATATEEELALAGNSPLVTLASHSWSHPNLARLDAATLREELQRPLEWLTGFGRYARWVAYPYGCYSEAVRIAAREAGYQGGVLVGGGGMSRREGDALLTPRVTVPAGLSTNGLILRVSGVAAEWWRGRR